MAHVNRKNGWATWIEPGNDGGKSVALPLGYSPTTRNGGGGQIELPNPGADLQSAAFSHFATPPKFS